MGLDMHLSASRYLSGWDHSSEESKAAYALGLQAAGLTRDDVADGAPSGEIVLRVGYWRKANAIHAWFVKNVQGGVDVCQEAAVSRKHMERLLYDCETVKADHQRAEDLLPPQAGFFFGSMALDEGYFEDIEQTIEIIKKCLGDKFKDFDFIYRSSW